MARYVVISIKDLSAQIMGMPAFVAHRNIAIRQFTDAVNRKDTERQNDLFAHADDFELYELGYYEDTEGSFDLYPKPELISQGKHVKQ